MIGSHLYRSALAALMAAVLCLLAPHSLPIGPVPISLATLGVYIISLFLPPIGAVQAVGAYLLLGACGLPVFAGYQSGAALIGPTAGFLWGYLPAAWLMAWLLRAPAGKRRTALCLSAGCAVILLCGALWYMVSASTPPLAALSVSVLPFLPGEAVKLTAATLLAPRLRRLAHAFAP